MTTIDISNDQFDYIDYSEGNIFFDKFSENEEFIIEVWGATLMQQSKLVKKDCYIAAISKLVFENVAYISIYYGLYEIGGELKKNTDGTSTNMYYELGKRENLEEYAECTVGGILGKDLGYGEMTIYCKGKIRFTYDENALIDVGEYCKNPEKYAFCG